MAFTFNKQNFAVAFGVRYEPNMFLKGFVRCMCLLSMFRNENQPQNRCTPPTGRKTRCLFFSAFVLSTTQTSTTNKQEKTTIWTLCKLLWSSQNIFPIAGLSAASSQSVDCCDPICQLMFYVLFVSLSGVYPRSSPPLPVESFCSSTIWRVTKEEQLYFSIGVQESEFSVCLMLLNILRLKESAWISQCVSRLLSTLTLSWHLLLSFGTRMFLLQKTKLDHDEVWHDNTLVTVESLPCKGPYTPGRISARVIPQRFSTRFLCSHPSDFRWRWAEWTCKFIPWH